MQFTGRLAALLGELCAQMLMEQGIAYNTMSCKVSLGPALLHIASKKHPLQRVLKVCILSAQSGAGVRTIR